MIGSDTEGSQNMGIGKSEPLWLLDEDGSAEVGFGVTGTVSASIFTGPAA
jgi:hypothetical protein